MNCKSCGKLLNKREEKRQYHNIPELLELCDGCLEKCDFIETDDYEENTDK